MFRERRTGRLPCSAIIVGYINLNHARDLGHDVSEAMMEGRAVGVLDPERFRREAHWMGTPKGSSEHLPPLTLTVRQIFICYKVWKIYLIL